MRQINLNNMQERSIIKHKKGKEKITFYKRIIWRANGVFKRSDNLIKIAKLSFPPYKHLKEQ